MRSPLRLLPTLVLLLLAAASMSAQTQPVPVPTAQRIAAMLQAANARRAETLKTYHSTRTYEVSYKGFGGDRQARMVVNVRYDNPGSKKFEIVSEEGSKLLRDRVLHRLLASEQEAADATNRAETELSYKNYSFELTGSETVNDHTLYVVRVTPKRKNKFLYDGRLWVDSQDYAVTRIEAKPAKNPSFWITQTDIQHSDVKHGDFWLPEKNVSRSHIRLGGDAVLTISYGDYVINTPDTAGSSK
jgi:outer membrane lipoprotein-sorting protein